ncbi:MAG: 30S ribosomal protein S19e [Hadesarchaea archaeon]|nr:MAG: 30S ribosomal protein S19e [Hadesarchaea archaeon]
MTMQEVDPKALLTMLKEELKKLSELQPAQWSHYVKTGVHKERFPEQPDWWHMRAASLLRRVYLNGPVGISRLRTCYGGRKNRGQAPEHFRKAGGKVIRTILQQLEQVGLVKKVERGGRKITPKGVAMLENLAKRIIVEQEGA